MVYLEVCTNIHKRGVYKMKGRKRLAQLLMKHPIKSIVITIIVIIMIGVGVRNIYMATGDDTLVGADTEVYKENKQLEEHFGGESIVVVYETESEPLLTPDHLQHMQGLEKELSAKDSVYSVVSPVTLVEHIAEKQAESYADGLQNIIAGLEEIGTQLNAIHTEMLENDSGESEFPDVDQQMADLYDGLEKMIEGQEKLAEGTDNLVGGYEQFSELTFELADRFEELMEQMPMEEQQLDQMNEMHTYLNQLGEQMEEVSTNGSELPEVANRTATGLSGIEEGLVRQEEQLETMQKNQQQKSADLLELREGLGEMGENLITMSEPLAMLDVYADIMTPGLPEKQASLEQMIFDDDGTLRPMFEEFIIDDQYMIMMITFSGQTDDADKSAVVNEVQSYIDAHPIEGLDMMASGKPVLDDSIRTSMKGSMQKMMGLAIAMMLVVLTFTFKVKWRLMPLVTILVAVVGTVGLMGWLQIPITMVSMAVFPILIGLGIDYAIQFQNRYAEEMTMEEDYDA